MTVSSENPAVSLELLNITPARQQQHASYAQEPEHLSRCDLLPIGSLRMRVCSGASQGARPWKGVGLFPSPSTLPALAASKLTKKLQSLPPASHRPGTKGRIEGHLPKSEQVQLVSVCLHGFDIPLKSCAFQKGSQGRYVEADFTTQHIRPSGQDSEHERAAEAAEVRCLVPGPGSPAVPAPPASPATEAEGPEGCGS